MYQLAVAEFAAPAVGSGSDSCFRTGHHQLQAGNRIFHQAVAVAAEVAAVQPDQRL